MGAVQNTSIDRSIFDDVSNYIDNNYEFKCNTKYKGLLGKVKAFLDRTDIEEKAQRESGASWIDDPVIFYSDPVSQEQREKDIQMSLARAIENSFSVTLMKYIELKNQSAVEIYKKANIDRKLFSKIRNEKRYMPSKRTAIALAIALELSLDETEDLLKRAGFTLSRSLLFDVIIEYFISKGIYDIYEINSILYAYKQPVLGE